MSCDNGLALFGSPSKTLMGYADALTGRLDYPILDVGCGYGRNAVALALRGASIVCVDRDLKRLDTLRFAAEGYIGSKTQMGVSYGAIYPVCAEVDEAAWPFASGNFSAIICVHFLNLKLLRRFAEALVPGGMLYIETFENRGRNYYDLPRSGRNA
jgi:tellurite methyltransferase